MTLDYIKILLGFEDDDSQDEILAILLSNAVSTINVYLGVNELPNELEFVAEQLAIIKYNKLGSEGISTEKIGIQTEKIDVLSTTYQADELASFKTILDSYKANNNLATTKRVKFL